MEIVTALATATTVEMVAGRAAGRVAEMEATAVTAGMAAIADRYPQTKAIPCRRGP